MDIQKGTVETVQGGRATVIPTAHPEITTRPLVLPFYWQERMGNIQPGDTVIFAETDDHDGVILARLDGEWDNTFRAPLTMAETVTAEKDVTAAGVSLQNHTHTSSQPGEPTSKPTA